MPIYQWRCNTCKEEFEEIRKIGDDKPPEHECESPDLQRIVTGARFVTTGTWSRHGKKGSW